MTKENREKAYRKFRDEAANYDGIAHSGAMSTTSVRAHAKKIADDMLKKHPELDKPKEVKGVKGNKEVNPKEVK